MLTRTPRPDVSDFIAEAPSKPQSLFAPRRKIYPKLAKGRFRQLKWIVMAVTLGIYYAVPWIRWDRGPYLPRQAILLDMEQERFFFFGLEIWPQEFYIVTGLLILAALTLFLATSIAGRMWCGYFCPQTVWTDLMIAVERFWEGDRNARIRLDAQPLAKRVLRRSLTHVSWLLIALFTGGAFVFYFADAPTLAREIMTASAPAPAYVFIALFTFTTYLLGGIAREQVCTYMCPWPRIQGGLIDHNTLLIAYNGARGEPRGSHHKGASWEGHGDCVDCRACVSVCPTGVDIRNGLQLECIQCALCIDACNEIMARVGRPGNLISYGTIAKADAAAHGTAAAGIIRTRTVVYTALISAVGLALVMALATRSMLELTVLPDRNPLYVRLTNGDIRNGFTLKILNKQQEPRRFTVSLQGSPGAELILDGQRGNEVEVPTDILREIKAYVSSPADTGRATDVTFVVRDERSGAVATHAAHLARPVR